jgi:hypothetical protein
MPRTDSASVTFTVFTVSLVCGHCRRELRGPQGYSTRNRKLHPYDSPECGAYITRDEWVAHRYDGRLTKADLQRLAGERCQRKPAVRVRVRSRIDPRLAQ